MPKQYRVVVTLFDDAGDEVATSTHEETYEDDQQAQQLFELKDQAAQAAGKGSV